MVVTSTATAAAVEQAASRGVSDSGAGSPGVSRGGLHSPCSCYSYWGHRLCCSSCSLLATRKFPGLPVAQQARGSNSAGWIQLFGYKFDMPGLMYALISVQSVNGSR